MIPVQSPLFYFFLWIISHFSTTCMYSRLIDSIAEKATLKRATKPAAALNFLSTTTPHAIFHHRPGLLEVSSSAVLERVVSCVLNGGTAVIGGLFSSFVRPLDMGEWFCSHWDRQWEAGGLPSDNAVPQLGCAKGATSVWPASRVQPESCVSQECCIGRGVVFAFPPTSVDKQQIPIALAPVGEGSPFMNP